MRLLVVFCHPAPESYLRSVLDQLTATLAQDGHQIDLIDLYAEGFDPVLDVEGWRAHRRLERHDPGLDRHIAALQAADGLILIFPTWWFGMPAMLKGWIDRVWQPGVAFTIRNDVFQPRKLDRVKRFAVVTSYGSARFLVEWVVGDPIRRQLTRGLAVQFARGVKTRWLPIYGMDRRTPPQLEKARDRIVARLRRFFAD